MASDGKRPIIRLTVRGPFLSFAGVISLSGGLQRELLQALEWPADFGTGAGGGRAPPPDASIRRKCASKLIIYLVQHKRVGATAVTASARPPKVIAAPDCGNGRFNFIRAPAHLPGHLPFLWFNLLQPTAMVLAGGTLTHAKVAQSFAGGLPDTDAYSLVTTAFPTVGFEVGHYSGSDPLEISFFLAFSLSFQPQSNLIQLD